MRTRIIHLINPKTDSLTTRPLYLNRALYSPLAGLLAVAASIPRDQHAAISEQDLILIGLAGLLCGRTALPPRTSTMSNGDRTLWGVCVAGRPIQRHDHDKPRWDDAALVAGNRHRDRRAEFPSQSPGRGERLRDAQNAAADFRRRRSRRPTSPRRFGLAPRASPVDHGAAHPPSRRDLVSG